MPINFTLLDTLIILTYLITVVVLGFFNLKNKNNDSKDYFLSGRNLSWFAIGMSIFAANISSEHFVGLAGSGATRGLAVGNFEFMAIFILVLLGWLIAPIFIKSGVVSLPEFIGKRFDERSRKFFAGFSIAVYIFTKITLTLFAGGFIFSKLFGLSIYTSAIIIVLITGLYTVIGGSTAVIRTSIFQGIVFILGALILTLFGLNEVGGISGLTSKLPADYFNMFKPMSDPDFPWTGILFGAPIIAFWYWITDQYIIQRILSAKNINQARTGSLFAALLKLLPIFIIVLPGLIAAILYPNVNGDEAYSLLLLGNLLPSGIKGFVLAGLLAAVMSSLSSTFNVTSTIYTNDFYRSKKPEVSEARLVLVGRLSSMMIVVVAILCVPLVKLIPSQIYLFLQGLQAYIGPPIAAVFIFGMFSKKVNSTGAIWTFIIGEFIGISKFILEKTSGLFISDSSFLNNIIAVNYLHFAILLFFISTIILYTISFIAASEQEKNTYSFLIPLKEIYQEMKFEINNYNSMTLYKINILFSVVLLISIVGILSVLF